MSKFAKKTGSPRRKPGEKVLCRLSKNDVMWSWVFLDPTPRQELISCQLDWRKKRDYFMSMATNVKGSSSLAPLWRTSTTSTTWSPWTSPLASACWRKNSFSCSRPCGPLATDWRLRSESSFCLLVTAIVPHLANDNGYAVSCNAQDVLETFIYIYTTFIK